MSFKKYLHVERFGTTEVEGIELGDCYVFSKLDGTNASVWVEPREGNILEVCGGSRNRQLSLENDNAGFLAWAKEQDNLMEFFQHYPNLRLYGEWLVPHSLKTYKNDAWNQFYVFDVMNDSAGKSGAFLHYNTYQPILKAFGIEYIPYIAKITNGSYEQFVKQLEHNVFKIQDGKGVGEGVVIKNYSFTNRYGRFAQAKIVTSEFKEKHQKEMGGHDVKGKKMVEPEIADEFVTKAMVDKVYAKIINEEQGWKSQYIPRLLNTVYYDLIREEIWTAIKKHKKPKIDFRTLQHFTFNKVKEHKPELF